MRYMNTVRTMFVLCCVVAAFCWPALADDPRFLSAYQSEYGLKLYSDGKIDFAVERFVKALLLDPQNKTAKESLRKISAQLTLSNNVRALKISRFIDQIEYFDFIDLRYRNLTEENARLFEFAQRNIAKGSVLLSKVQDIQAQQAQKVIIVPNVSIVGFALQDSQPHDLDDIISELSRERQRLLGEIDFWEKQNSQLRTLRRSVLGQNAVETAAVITNRYKSKLAEVENRSVEKDNLLAVQHQNLEYFQSELASVRENFNSLQEKFKSTDVKISELTKNLAEMSMEIMEKNKALADKDNYVVDLQREITEAHEKMSLVQRIIQEKDERIASLEKEMIQVQAAVNVKGVEPNQELVQLKAELKTFTEQFKSQMNKNRQRIIGLEVQFAALTQDYQMLVAEVAVKDSTIHSLRRDLAIKDLSMEQYHKAFLTANQKTNELMGMIDIYRGKLIEVKQSLLSKEKELSRLKGDITKEKINMPQDNATVHNDNYPGLRDLIFLKNDYPLIVSEGR